MRSPRAFDRDVLLSGISVRLTKPIFATLLTTMDLKMVSGESRS